MVECGGPSAKARQSQKAIMQHKHPKNGKPLLRIQPLQKELARAISHDVCLAQVPVAVGEQLVLDKGTDVGCADTSACVGLAVVGPPCLPLVGDGYFDENIEPDPDLFGSGFGWDDPDDF